MTTTPGPVALQVLTLCCRTDDQQCLHYGEWGTTKICCHASGRGPIYTSRVNGRVPTPKWCPLRDEGPPT